MVWDRALVGCQGATHRGCSQVPRKQRQWPVAIWRQVRWPQPRPAEALNRYFPLDFKCMHGIWIFLSLELGTQESLWFTPPLPMGVGECDSPCHWLVRGCFMFPPRPQWCLVFRQSPMPLTSEMRGWVLPKMGD